MTEINQDDIIIDIRRVAAKLNQSKLTKQEYAENGGRYLFSFFEEHEDEIGSFANNVELAGLKYMT
ncbi:MAG: hypothetical protein LIO99_08140 [Clostridiales bacterium]|nr:hypothetical protein [Clostridiales bacterium]